MKILAIETSCDETACAIVEDGTKVLANVIYSQVKTHAATGGVVPEVAAREHVMKMLPVINQALDEAKSSWEDIEAIAVTKGPGLISSLIIGTQTASVIAYIKNKPLIPVQHITGHIYSNWLETEEEVQFPILILTVSGGHNELILMRDHHEFEILGETRDDAAGEAFDKVARILGLGYPGGPIISKMAEKGNRAAFKLPVIMLEKESLDFSFSGLKTAVLNEAKAYLAEHSNLSEKFQADLSASFEETAVTILNDKLFRALENYPEVKEIHLAGGVSANRRLREKVEETLRQRGEKITLRYPKSLSYCTDNAAMIGSSGYFMYKKNPERFLELRNVYPDASMEISA